MCGNTFGRPIWPPRPIFDLPGPSFFSRFLTGKIGFLTVRLCRRTAGSNLPNGPFAARYGSGQTAPRPQKACGNTFGHSIWSPRPILDLTGPRKNIQFLTEKVGFLTVRVCRRTAGSNWPNGPFHTPFGPEQTGADLNKCAETFSDTIYGFPDPYLTFLEPSQNRF